jgi:glycine/D-amino acid oxidase-like deaminating enzyme
LLQHGKKVLVVDKGLETSSSKAAAGIFNPVTGKRLVKTWQADHLFSFLQEYYTNLEKDLGVKFLHLLPIYRPYASIEEQNAWTAQTSSPDLIPYTDTQTHPQRYASYVHSPYGGLLIRQSGYVDLPLLLNAYKQFLKSQDAYRQEQFTQADVTYTATKVIWKDVAAKKILFCEGTYNHENPYFNWLPFNQVKGELLLVHIPGMVSDCIVSRGIFVLPLGGEIFKVGATYVWNDLSWQPTMEARAELTGKLQELIKLPFTIVNHLAGIRPASADRRPFIGLHPDNPVFGIFNGLGTKGVSLAPYFAQHFVEHLEQGKDLLKEVHINRYFSLYYKTK